MPERRKVLTKALCIAVEDGHSETGTRELMATLMGKDWKKEQGNEMLCASLGKVPYCSGTRSSREKN